MGQIRNLRLINKFFNFFNLKAADRIGAETGNIFVPVISTTIPPLRVRFAPTEAQFAAGITVPAGKKWRVLNCIVSWASDVTAGNREIVLQASEVDSVNSISAVFFVGSRNFQAASLTTLYSWYLGAGSPVGSSSGVFQTLPLPDTWLPERTVISVTDNAAIAAGDTLTGGGLIVEEEEMFDGEAIGRVVP